MTDQRIEGAGERLNGDFKSGLGRLTGDSKLQLDGALAQAKGTALDVYGQAMDGIDRLIDKAPVGLQDRARSTLEVARRKPLLTTAIVAGLGLLLANSGRRR